MINFLKNIFNSKTLPRKVFTFYFFTILIGSIILLLPISRNHSEAEISLLDSIFTAASAFSDTGLVVKNTGTYFSLFGQIIILMLIQIGGIGLMAIKILFFMILGKKIGLEERLFITNERGSGKLGGSISLIKTALIAIFSMEIIATVLISIRYYLNYFDYFDRDIFKIFFQALFLSVSSVNNAGFDILKNSQSISLFSQDYYLQSIISICLIFGGLGFPLIYDFRNYFVNKINKRKAHLSFYSRFVLKGYFFIMISSIVLISIIEIMSGTILYNNDYSLIEKIFYLIFNTISTRNAGYSTIDLNEFSQASKLVFSTLMYIGAAPSSTGGGIRVTTFIIALLSIFGLSKNKKEITFMDRRIPQETAFRSLLIVFFSQIIIISVTISIVLQTPSTDLLSAFFEASSAFGTTGLSLGITSSLASLSKILIIVLMIVGQLGVSSTILLFSNKKMIDNHSTLPEEDILIN